MKNETVRVIMNEVEKIAFYSLRDIGDGCAGHGLLVLLQKEIKAEAMLSKVKNNELQSINPSAETKNNKVSNAF